MVTLVSILHILVPNAVPYEDFRLSEAGIDSWNIAKLGPQPTQIEIDAAELPAAKALRIEADRTECRRRLTEFYGDALEQVSRSSGLYGATAQANHAAGVSAAIDASNVARDQINAATTVAEVEAVTVAWPTLT